MSQTAGFTVSGVHWLCYIFTDAMIKTQDKDRRRKTSLTKYTSHFIVRVRKVYSRFACEREPETEQKLQYFAPQLLWPSTLCLSRSPDAQPEALESTLLGAGFLYCILSATSLVPNLHRGSRGPPRPCVAFPTILVYLPLQLYCNWHSTVWLLSWLSYIIVQRPLDLWNSMFDGHQAEITVMLFTSGASVYECHAVHFRFISLWVYRGNFFSSSHFISQFPHSRFPLITAIRMYHVLPVHHLEMVFVAGSKVKI